MAHSFAAAAAGAFAATEFTMFVPAVYISENGLEDTIGLGVGAALGVGTGLATSCQTLSSPPGP